MVTDSFGRKIDFRNTIIILTSNVGAESIAKGGNTLGFLVDVDENSEDRYALGLSQIPILFDALYGVQ